MTKRCKKCGEEKDIVLFSKHTSTKDKLKTRCKECDRIIENERYLLNSEKRIAKTQEWQAANQEKVKKYKKQWREKHKTSLQKSPTDKTRNIDKS